MPRQPLSQAPASRRAPSRARGASRDSAARTSAAEHRLGAAQARRLVVKLGTGILTHDDGSLAFERCQGFVRSLAALRRAGREVIVVTSGAVGLGADRLGIAVPKDMPMRQACAAVGQGRLMAFYADAFYQEGLVAAQVLLTRDDFASPQRYLNLRRTLTTLLEQGVVPVINENDTVSTDELAPAPASFSDNDRLSALVAGKVGAELLLILTDVEGLYTGDPRAGDAQLIPLVEQVTEDVEQLAGGAFVGRGGMRTKVAAAAYAARCGCATIIAGGRAEGVIERALAGEAVGTLFLPEPGATLGDALLSRGA